MVMEFWVMRVLLHPGPARRKVTFGNLPNNEHAHAIAAVESGSLCCLPDGCIAEPVEVFKGQLDAEAHREQLAADNPDNDYRVILNTSVTV